MRLFINIVFTGDLEEEDIEALREDLEDEFRYYGGSAVVEIERG